MHVFLFQPLFHFPFFSNNCFWDVIVDDLDHYHRVDDEEQQASKPDKHKCVVSFKFQVVCCC